MTFSIKDFFNQHLQEVYSYSDSSTGFDETVFVELMCEMLVDEAVLENYIPVSFKKDRLGLRVDAYDYSEENGILTLIISKFSNEYGVLNQSEVSKLFKRLEKLYVNSLDLNFLSNIEETELAYGLIKQINNRYEAITGIKFIIISNLELSNRFKNINTSSVNGISINHEIWDLTKIFNKENSKTGKESLEINFLEQFEQTIPCLRASNDKENHQSYLFMLSGKVLAELYDMYSERLLEQNVRTFLQFRGNVNKGMRNTIKNEPELFFAFNNGLTATAEELIFCNENQSMIQGVKNLQIVNGGQTTASIYNTYKRDKADLSQVFVQVKLTVVKPEEIEGLVPRISEYANTQNKVNAADFFSNSSFHWEMEKLSRRLFAPSSSGNHKQTHWFYERARGQYLTSKNNGTDSSQKQFELLNPKNQLITKTDLAKYHMSFAKKPYLVSLGAQKNFSIFANDIAKEWDKDETQFNELYFKQLIAKAIIFKQLDKAVAGQKNSWYGGYKANIVTYALAKLMSILEDKKLRIDFNQIWNSQLTPEPLLKYLLKIAEQINYRIKLDAGNQNITQYCKKEACWLRIDKELKISYDFELWPFMINKEEKKAHDKTAKEIKKIDTGIELQRYVLSKTAENFWQSILEWNKISYMLSEKDISLLGVAINAPKSRKIPSEAQCKQIIKIEKKAVLDGFFID